MTGRYGVGVSVVLGVVLLLTSSQLEARRKKPHKKPKHAPAAAAAAPAPAESDSEADETSPAETPPAKAEAPAGEPKKPKGPKVMDFSGLSVEGKLRTPQLLYFLGRVKEELQRASLENRSFMPELVRSVDEGAM